MVSKNFVLRNNFWFCLRKSIYFVFLLLSVSGEFLNYLASFLYTSFSTAKLLSTFSKTRVRFLLGRSQCVKGPRNHLLCSKMIGCLCVWELCEEGETKGGESELCLFGGKDCWGCLELGLLELISGKCLNKKDSSLTWVYQFTNRL
jgi:hypothetical protein